jgi:hypothetical protein
LDAEVLVGLCLAAYSECETDSTTPTIVVESLRAICHTHALQLDWHVPHERSTSSASVQASSGSVQAWSGSEGTVSSAMLIEFLMNYQFIFADRYAVYCFSFSTLFIIFIGFFCPSLF